MLRFVAYKKLLITHRLSLITYHLKKFFGHGVSSGMKTFYGF